MADPIVREYRIEAREAENGQITVIASAPTVDRMGDIVEAPWDLQRFASNPVIQWAHRYDIPPVGRATSVTVDADGVLMMDIEFDESPENPLGRTVASQMRRGFLNAVSVGFAPGESVRRSSLPKDDPRYGEEGWVYRNSELLETSVVPIPANPQALAIRRALEEMEPIKRTVEERAAEAMADPEVKACIEAWILSEPAAPVIKDAADALSNLFGPDPISTVFGHSD